MESNEMTADIQVDASEFMTKNVVTVEPGTTIDKAIDLMATHKISGMPVVNKNNELVGVVSKKDIFAVAKSSKAIPDIEGSGWLSPHFDRERISEIHEGLSVIGSTKVEEIMNTTVIYVREQTPLYKVARMMQNMGVNRLPVIDKEDRLAGIISRQDIIDCIKKGAESVSGIMNKQVLSVEPEATLDKAIEIFAKHNVSSIPVINDNNQLVGIVSERDIADFIDAQGSISPRAHDIILAIHSFDETSPKEEIYHNFAGIVTGRKVEEVMNKKVASIKEKTTLQEAVKIMKEKNINHLPVLDEKERLSGIVTRQDIINYISRVGPAE